MSRTGRRPGPTSSRGAILDAARRQFAAAGYDATSLRAIAAEAGVDVAVVMHFFGSKDALFRAVVGWPFDPSHVVQHLTAPGHEPTGARFARFFLGVWEDPQTGAALAALLRSAMTHQASAALLRDFVVHDQFARLAGLVDGPAADVRVELAVGHLLGVAVLRYVLRVEPIASASVDELVTWLAPALTNYLAPATAAGPGTQ